jgi:uncharacterized protein
MSTPEAVEVTNNAARSEFEVELGGKRAVIMYGLHGDTVTFTHTEVPPEFEGKGIAGKMAKAALDWAQASGYSVVPQCPFVRTYIERHPEYQPLVKG